MEARDVEYPRGFVLFGGTLVVVHNRKEEKMVLDSDEWAVKWLYIFPLGIAATVLLGFIVWAMISF